MNDTSLERRASSGDRVSSSGADHRPRAQGHGLKAKGGVQIHQEKKRFFVFVSAFDGDC
jgi:hypothetical protein